MPVQYDAIIVGARVAGLATAALLSRTGFRVLLLDRAQLPKPTLSSPLYFANTLHLLGMLGALPRVQALGAPEIRHYQVRALGIFLRGRMLPFHGVDYAYSIRRERFDAVLFDHVAALPGVEARLGMNVMGPVWDQRRTRVVGVRAGREGGAQEELCAEVVVGADGVYSTMARGLGAGEYRTKPAHACVYYAYYSNMPPVGNEPTATLYHDAAGPCIFITADSDQGSTVVSLSLPASRFEEVRRDPESLHARFAAQIPELAARLRGAVRETPVYGVPPRPSYYRLPYGPGWILVGDSGYYKDPLTGQGVYDALRSAELAADSYTEYRQGADWRRAMQRYQDVRDHETRAMYEFTDYYSTLERSYSPQERGVIRAIAEMPPWADRFVSIFDGVTDPGRYMATPNLFRIYAEWQVRRLWQRLTGRATLRPAEVQR